MVGGKGAKSSSDEMACPDGVDGFVFIALAVPISPVRCRTNRGSVSLAAVGSVVVDVAKADVLVRMAAAAAIKPGGGSGRCRAA
jgi:hypothetical protein